MSKSVLFVCTGNICRSPVAEVLCKKMTSNKVKSDSAALSSLHINEMADDRAIDIAKKHGMDMSQHRARQIRYDDWLLYDFVVALDEKVYNSLQKMKPNTSKAEIVLYGNIKDPYFAGRTGFNNMYNEIANQMPQFLSKNSIFEMQ